MILKALIALFKKEKEMDSLVNSRKISKKTQELLEYSVSKTCKEIERCKAISDSPVDNAKNIAKKIQEIREDSIRLTCEEIERCNAICQQPHFERRGL